MYETTSLAIINTPGCFRSTVNNPSILKCRQISPYYLDMRVVPSFPEYMDIVVDDMVDMIDRSMDVPGRFDKLITTETAGLPICSMVSSKLGIGMGWSKKQPKGYGLGKTVEGYIAKGEHVLGVDDLTTEATTARIAINNVRNIGAEIDDYCVIHDRNQGAQEALADLNVRLHCLSQTNPRFMKLALEKKKITSEEFKTLDYYAQNPKEWSKKFVRNNPLFIKKRLADVIKDGRITDYAPLEVLTVGHPDIKSEFDNFVKYWLEGLGVRHEVSSFDYKP